MPDGRPGVKRLWLRFASRPEQVVRRLPAISDVSLEVAPGDGA